MHFDYFIKFYIYKFINMENIFLQIIFLQRDFGIKINLIYARCFSSFQCSEW